MNKQLALLSICSLGAIMMLAGAVQEAHASAFMKLGDIKGEATDKGHKDEIDVLSWSWGMSQSSSGTGGGGSGRVNVQDMSVTKYVDSSSTEIYRTLVTGQHLGDVTIAVSSKKYSGSEPYLIYKLKDVIITSVSTGGSGGEDRLTENVTLNFEEVQVTYQAFDDKKKSGDPHVFQFNVLRHAP